MKFGFSGGNLSTNVQHFEDIISVVKFGEDLGYDSVWFSDRLRDVFVTLSMCALSTRKIRLCSGVVNPFTRHPTSIARAIAAVDELCNGRSVLGIGAGNRYEVAADLGFESTLGYEKVRETAIIAQNLFLGNRFSYEGKHFRVQDVKLGIKCRPDIPIYIAASGKKILQVAGEVANGVIIPYGNSESLQKARNLVVSAAQKANRDPSTLRFVGWLMTSITDERKKALKSMRSFCALMIVLTPMDFLVSLGIKEEQAQLIKKRYIDAHIDPTLENKYWMNDEALIPDDVIDLLTLVGTAQQVSQKMESLFRTGFDEFSLLLPSANLPNKRHVLEIFARDVMPNFV